MKKMPKNNRSDFQTARPSAPQSFNRIALAVHLSLCPCCREYKKQLELISNAMHKMFR